MDQFPDAPRLEAWTLLNKVRAGRSGAGNSPVEAAVAAAEQMTKTHPDNPWSTFALAGALNWHDERNTEALAVSKQALEQRPTAHDFIWMRAEVLRKQKSNEAAVTFIDDHVDAVDNPAELLSVKGVALYYWGREESDDAKIEKALATFEQARQLDPDNVNVHFLPGAYLMNLNRTDEALPLLKQAATLAPRTPTVHDSYWNAVIGTSTLTPEEKRIRVETDVNRLLNQSNHAPKALHRAAGAYGELGLDEKQHRLEDRILTRAPNSLPAEWVIVERYRRFRDIHRDSMQAKPELRTQYRQMLKDFIARPTHHHEGLLGNTYLSLFHASKDDSTVSDDELLAIINGMAQHEDRNASTVYAKSAIALAERGAHFDRAQELAQQGLKAARNTINEQRERGLYDSEEEYERAMDWYTGLMHDALGWVYFHEGQMEKAKDALMKAYDLHAESVTTLYHLGRFYEAHDQLAKAEHYYIQGVAEQTMGANPNDEALKKLYQRREGSLEGYEDYLASVTERQATKQKEEVLANRIEDPEALSPFTLATLDGDSLSSSTLKGQVAVINVWGLWCSPCVEEMPDIQALHEKYDSDPSVVVLTINNDQNPDEVRTWMNERDYDFPVLRDDGYLLSSGIRAFPTTWFVNPNGEIEFIKRGYTEDLVERFSWRIHALHPDAAQRSSR